jgi:hypothetical protein
VVAAAVGGVVAAAAAGAGGSKCLAKEPYEVHDTEGP